MGRSWQLLTTGLAAIVVSATTAHAAGALDGAELERLTGAKGTLDAKEGVFKVSLPRADIAASAAGVRLTPPLGLTAWAAFMKAGDHLMVMGDMVMLEDQVNPVMSVALENGLEVTALHNHFFWDSPRIMFMHVGGMGDQAALGAAIGKVFAKIKETAGGKGKVPRAEIDPAKTTLAAAAIDRVFAGLGKGDLANGVYKIVFGRTVKMDGHTVGKAMGVNTWAAFAGSDEKAVVDGDFAMLESELQPVLKVLRGGNIDVVAIHNHMTGESPRIMFLHYWGVGRTAELASTLKLALSKTKHQTP
jgi:hypothetical protein